MPKLILDASFIISWGVELKDPIIFDKLQEAGFDCVVPKRVTYEVESKNPIIDHILANSEVRGANPKEYSELSSRYFRLGAGEIAVLVLGKQMTNCEEGYFCVLDDRLAREAASKLGQEYTGTIGLLAILVRDNLLELEKADELIQEMKDTGTRLPEDHLKLLKESI